MPLIYRKMFVFALLFIPSIFTIANENCGVVNIASDDQFVLDLQQIDNESIYPNKTIKKILDGHYSINLTPGPHILNIGVVLKKEYKGLWRKNRAVKQAKSLNVKFVQLDVKENTHYRLALSEDNSTIIVNEKNVICSVDKADNVFGERRNTFFDKALLPLKEEAQLNSIMYRLANENVNAEETIAVFNVLPLKVDPYFGSIIDTLYSKNDTLIVRHVLPNSLAAYYGLHSGDEIIKLGNNETYNNDIPPRDVMNNYLLEAFQSPKQSVNYINMTVRRSDRLIEIGGKFHSNIIPQSTYIIGNSIESNNMITYKALPKNINFEYDRLLLLLQDHYYKKGMSDKQIIIKRDRQRNERMGFTVQEIIGKGLQVISIDEDNVLKSIGLNKEDILLSLNNDSKPINQSNTLTKRLNISTESETITLKVLRNDKVITLSGEYHANYLPNFTLNIDMASIGKGVKLINDEKFGDPRLRGLHHQWFRGKRTTVGSQRSSHSRDIKN